MTGQFTTNPGLVWSQYLADFYGTSARGRTATAQTGPNYAAGGARVGVDVTGALGPIPSLATQVNTYLAANGGRADPNALFTAWGGANDLFLAAATSRPGAAAGHRRRRGRRARRHHRHAAGRRRALRGRADGARPRPDAVLPRPGPGRAGRRHCACDAYNTALFGALASNGLSVIPVDTFTFLREVAADPAAFGFTNITGTACQPQITANSLICNPTSYVSPNAPETYLFADGVHPTSRAHGIVADLAVSALEGPRQIAVLPHSAAMTGRARAERVGAHLNAKPEGDGMRWWGDLRGDFQRYGHGDHYDGVGPALTGGVDWTSGDFVFGGFAGYGVQDNDWGLRRGSWDQDELRWAVSPAGTARPAAGSAASSATPGSVSTSSATYRSARSRARIPVRPTAAT